ncbi:multidrug transporter subunit MdtN [Trinickia fusca]|uniref:Multidrug transporter subunit MdtN n=1 Tax=Trinickia fusca TaxID=2419777 RepID=A0A494X6M8_9BURK|nr:multidrug transporter subunit MdtN [Trinickia fusca]RKP46357.1 multidrug transporter subunit MdtN [Trinickia fusca]
MTTPTTSQKSNKAWLGIALVVLTVLVLIFVVWRLDREPRTDDAYAYADTIDVVPEVSGRIVELAVHDNQAVKQGDLLFQIDPRPYQDALTRAKANLVALDKQIELTQRTVNAQQYNAQSVRAAVERARAAATQATDTLHRTAPLLSQGYVSAQDVDLARTAQRATQAELAAAELQAQQAAAAVSGVDALVAQRAVAEAEIAIAELNLEFATVRAPFDGWVVSLKTSTGQFASALKPVFTLIDARHWYVVANFRETELKGIRAGTRANVYLMSDTSQRFRGTVDSISYGVLPNEGGLALPGGLPRIERTLNWVHVAQRFPVKIRVENPNPDLFRIGTSAVAVLYPGRSIDAGHR